jgi:hypothetical protein
VCVRPSIILLLCGTLSVAAKEINTAQIAALMVDGVIYSNVTFGAVTPATVTVSHKTGVAKIPLEKLSPALQKQFSYDPQKAADYRAAEARQAELAQARERELRVLKAQEEADRRVAEQAAEKAAEKAAKRAKAAAPSTDESLNPVVKLNFRYAYGIGQLPDGTYSAFLLKSEDNQVIRVRFPAAGATYMNSATRVHRSGSVGWGWGQSFTVGGTAIPYSVYGQLSTFHRQDVYGTDITERAYWLVGDQIVNPRPGVSYYEW